MPELIHGRTVYDNNGDGASSVRVLATTRTKMKDGAGEERCL